MSTETTEALIERVLAEHVPVGGTYWDGERKTTFTPCRCGVKGYCVEGPSHAAHVAAAITQALAESHIFYPRATVQPARRLCDPIDTDSGRLDNWSDR